MHSKSISRQMVRNATGVYELLPGDVVLALAGDQLKTLLGSCVSVILTDPHRTVATMNHIVHVGQPTSNNKGNTAFGVYAMEEMFLRLRGIGVTHRLCHAYVYGGGNMFPHLFSERHVGISNADWVMDYLQTHHIAVVAQSLGGVAYRKISWTVGPNPPEVETVQAQMDLEHGD